MKSRSLPYVMGRFRRSPVALGLLLLGVLLGVTAIWAAEREQVLGFAPGGNGVPEGWELFVNAGEADLALV